MSDPLVVMAPNGDSALVLLPHELTAHILSHMLKLDLKACCLAHSTLNVCAIPVLFEELYIAMRPKPY